jgi:ankyrin repeat protein
MSSALPGRPDLRFEKKQAKALLKAFQEGDSTALARMRAHLPRLKDAASTPATLADAQFVLARERGFESWPKLKAHIEGLRPVQDQVMPFLQAACNGHVPLARRILAAHPALPIESFQAAAAAADVKALAEWVAKRPTMMVRQGSTLVPPSPHVKPLSLPLLAACASHLHKVGPTVASASLQCVRMLLDNRADANSKDTSDAHLPALYHACMANNVPVVRLLLERGANPNDEESVHHSAEHNHRECLETLLAHGANLNGTGPQWQKTVLFFLAEIGAQPAGVEWLLEHGADPNIPSGDLAEVPLHRATANGNLAMTDLLLRHGANANAVRKDGRTSYSLALRTGNTEIAERLRKAGAHADEPTVVDQFLGASMRADEVAARALVVTNPGLVESLGREEQLLFFQAADRERIDAVRLMVSLGFDVGMIDDDGNVALHVAAWRGRVAMAKELIRLGSPINVKDKRYGGSPLQFAAHGSQYCRKADADYCEIIDALVNAGATPEHPANDLGERPSGSRAVLAHLRKKGFLADRK